MRLTPLAAISCGTTSCPQVYLSDRGTIVVQGTHVDSAETDVATATGEVLVEIPMHLFRTAAGGAAAEPA